MSDCIKSYDQKIEELGEKYGQTKLLRQVKGVGPITALGYVLTLENPEWFDKSRDVGPRPESDRCKESDAAVSKLCVSGSPPTTPGAPFAARPAIHPTVHRAARLAGAPLRARSCSTASLQQYVSSDGTRRYQATWVKW